MKKIISFICMTMILLSMSMTAFAGSIPEDLLHSDDAQIFFAEVVCYHPDKENPDIELSPVKVIKGDVKTGVKLTYYNPNTVGNFKVKEGNVYLFTYFDENNPTDIFEVTSYDTSTLKLKNVEGDMWKRFEKYLNEGRYLDADHARLDKQNEGLPVEGAIYSQHIQTILELYLNILVGPFLDVVEMHLLNFLPTIQMMHLLMQYSILIIYFQHHELVFLNLGYYFLLLHDEH